MWGTRLALPVLVLAACCELGEGCPAAGGGSGGQGEAESREVRRAWGAGTDRHQQRGTCGPGRVRTGTAGGTVQGWDWQGGWPPRPWVPSAGNGPSSGAWAPGMGSPLGQAGKVRVTFPDSGPWFPGQDAGHAVGTPGRHPWGGGGRKQRRGKRTGHPGGLGSQMPRPSLAPLPTQGGAGGVGPSQAVLPRRKRRCPGRHSNNSGGGGPGCGGLPGAPVALEGRGQPSSLCLDPPGSLWA